jgi:hypothetical protein
MNQLIQSKNTTILPVLIALTLGCFALSPQARAACLDGCNNSLFNVFQGDDALLNNTTGSGNTALGWRSLFSNTAGSFNTGVGSGALALNSAAANSSTAVGAGALLLNTIGFENVAVGTDALVFNESGFDNNAVGAFALFNNVSGNFNNAHGRLTLGANVDGSANNAFGDQALSGNTSGGNNDAFGDHAMAFNTTGSFNTAIGNTALEFCDDGDSNVAIGALAGESVVHGSNIICIGAAVTGGGGPFADTSNTCFIGNIYNRPVSDPVTATAVFVDQFNVLGFNPSTRRVKHDIRPMDSDSETLYALKPVTFKYNNDNKSRTQFGLIAEEVANVNPDLVLRDNDGNAETIRYEQVNAMLLNEFLKEHKKVEEQQGTIAQLKSTVAQQQESFEAKLAKQEQQIDALTAGLQKVSARLELSKLAPRTVLNNQ